MKIAPLLLIFICNICYAALPPRAQNERDLDILVEFIKEHELILATLDWIDFEHYTIYYQTDCKVVFERGIMLRLPGWAGPAAPLKFKNATCKIDY